MATKPRPVTQRGAKSPLRYSTTTNPKSTYTPYTPDPAVDFIENVGAKPEPGMPGSTYTPEQIAQMEAQQRQQNERWGHRAPKVPQGWTGLTDQFTGNAVMANEWAPTREWWMADAEGRAALEAAGRAYEVRDIDGGLRDAYRILGRLYADDARNNPTAWFGRDGSMLSGRTAADISEMSPAMWRKAAAFIDQYDPDRSFDLGDGRTGKDVLAGYDPSHFDQLQQFVDQNKAYYDYNKTWAATPVQQRQYLSARGVNRVGAGAWGGEGDASKPRQHGSTGPYVVDPQTGNPNHRGSLGGDLGDGRLISRDPKTMGGVIGNYVAPPQNDIKPGMSGGLGVMSNRFRR